MFCSSVQGDLLSYLSPRLLVTLASFKPPSAESSAVLASGRVRSSFATSTNGEEQEGDTQVLHDEWKKIISEFSQAMVRLSTTTAPLCHSLLPICLPKLCPDDNISVTRLSGG